MSVELAPDISIFNLPRWIPVLGEYEQHTEAIRLIGANGLQYASVTNFRDNEVGRKLVEDGVVHSFHQSFVQRGISIYRLAMPTVDGSLVELEPLEAVARNIYDEWLPVVVHPNEQFLGNRPPRRWINYKSIRDSGKHGPLIFQPTVELLERWCVLDREDPVSTASDMFDVQKRLGFDSTAVALDLHHLQARRGAFEALDLDWCIGFVGALAMHGSLDNPGEVQMSFRPDFGGDKKHLAQAVNGELPETPQGQLFARILEMLPVTQENLRVTLEVPSRAFRMRDIRLDYIEGNRKLIEAMGEMALAA